MKRELRGFITGVIVTVMLLSTVAFSESVKQTIEVVLNSVNLEVNGKKVEADNILYNGTTYVPLRAVAEMLGKEVGWDQETKTASINDKGVSNTSNTSNTSNYNRNNPAPIGVKQTVTVEKILEKYTAEVTVTDVIRGDGAWKLIKAANMFNEEPGAEEDYILVKIRVKVIDVEGDKKVDISPVYFNIYSGDNVEYDNIVFATEPEPSIRTSLYAGGEHEGYAVYKVKKSDTNPKLVFGQEYDGTGGIWFKLSK